MVLLNAGRLPFRRLVSLRKLDELRQIVVSEARVTIGAAVTYTQIQRHPVLQSEFPLLCQAASWTGGLGNQNQGTLGGNIANASPAADSSPPLLVHDAEIRLISLAGSRSVSVFRFPPRIQKVCHAARRTALCDRSAPPRSNLALSRQESRNAQSSGDLESLSRCCCAPRIRASFGDSTGIR